MNKRDFLKAGLLIGAAAQLPTNASAGAKKKTKLKNWIWIRPNQKDTEDDLKKQYASFKAAGISAVFIEADSEKHFRAAKAAGLEAHRWMWTMNRGELVNVHPDWYAVN